RGRPREVKVCAQLATDRSGPKHLQPLSCGAVDGRRVDVRAVGVHLLCRAGLTGARGGLGVAERDTGGGVLELFQRVGLAERNVLPLTAVYTQRDVAVDELAPDEAPATHVALREDVLARVVEHTVADEAGVRPLH